MINLNKKDIISINQEIGESGEMQNESSLDFALSMFKQKKSWLQELSYLIRSILIDHVFRDGNKRTALALVLSYFDDRNLAVDKEKLLKIIHEIPKKNYSSISKIMRVLQDAIIH